MISKKKAVALVVFTFIFTLSIWCIDVSITTLNLGIMTNGFTNLKPTQTYHLGLYSAMVSFIIVVLIAISQGGKNEKK